MLLTTQQRNPKLIIALFLFVVFLVLGFQGGKLYNQTRGNHGQQVTPLPTINRPQTKQSNTLLIIADDLSSKRPNLISVWLLIKTDEPPNLIFLPIYPQTENASSEYDRKFAKAIDFDSTGFPTQYFWNTLISSNLWWDHYIIFDKQFIGEIIDSIGGIKYENTNLGGAEALTAVASISDKSNLSTYEQLIIAKAICDKIHNGEINELINTPFTSQSPNHLHTNLRIGELDNLWGKTISTKPNFDCEFPLQP